MTALNTEIEPKPMTTDTKPRSFLSITDLTADELLHLFDLGKRLKADPSIAAGRLAGKQIAMIFEKPSLRTRVSFDAGINRLGGYAMYLDESRAKLGEREPVKDYARNLERYVDGIVARVHDHNALVELAANCSIPVVNALSDLEHPCQAAADFMTIEEHLGSLDGVKLAWVGDGNNVCHSLMLLAAVLGVSMTVVTPKGFEPSHEILRSVLKFAEPTGATITLSNELSAVEGHHAVYTDKWVSMGQDHQKGLRTDAFENVRVTEDLMEIASKGLERPALFMHCLPAKRGEEVEAAVIDGPNSVVYDQAENRMHAQNALLLFLFNAADV
ncbi:MAG: ornithine carbamoyltransferase [Planctomycetota bacterium]